VAQTTEIQVPDIGGSTDAGVIEVLVSEGQTIGTDTPLITLETEKATMDVPSPLAGRVVRIIVKKGDKVAQGSAILLVEAAAGALAAAAAPPAASPAPPAAAPLKTASAPPQAALTAPAAVDEIAFSRAYASPSVRKFARELGVDLGKVKGTAAKQRISQEDVKRLQGLEGVSSVVAAVPVAVWDRAGEGIRAPRLAPPLTNRIARLKAT